MRLPGDSGSACANAATAAVSARRSPLFELCARRAGEPASAPRSCDTSGAAPGAAAVERAERQGDKRQGGGPCLEGACRSGRAQAARSRAQRAAQSAAACARERGQAQARHRIDCRRPPQVQCSADRIGRARARHRGRDHSGQRAHPAARQSRAGNPQIARGAAWRHRRGPGCAAADRATTAACHPGTARGRARNRCAPP